MRSDSRNNGLVTVAQLGDFDEIIDTRSESEFAEDHIPGAVNCPVLTDEERVRVGTLYKQVSAFEAKKLGAVLVGRNIARHIETVFAQRPQGWRPLVYCWRGGGRSGALAHVLQQVGWHAARIEGGYKSFRRTVIADLQIAPARYRWRVVCGLTGSGKSRLLRALLQRGAQVLDLEALAAHRGSVLGNLPGAAQPAQKMFESLVWDRLRSFDPAQPVFVEAESKKVGNLRVPQSLIDVMWKSACVKLEASIELRVQMLMDEYSHFVADAKSLGAQLDCLAAHYGQEQIGAWKTMAARAEWQPLVRELLQTHYDPAYTRSTLKNYPQLGGSPVITIASNDDSEFERAADRCLVAAGVRLRVRSSGSPVAAPDR